VCAEEENRRRHPKLKMDLRDKFIAQVIRDASFADVGGLWGTVNEKVSVAARNGARSLAMIDVSEPASELWTLFRERLLALNIGPCECVCADVCELAASESRPLYDVVHCSGVLYHHPSPLLLLQSLRAITRRHLILTSAITQEVVQNEAGTIRIPPFGSIFIPALDQRERDVLWKHWRDNAGVGSCWGISDPVAWNVRDLGPWWWLFTAKVMLAAAESASFRVLDSGPTWNGNAHTALLEAK
jgi:hypothetical protein